MCEYSNKDEMRWVKKRRLEAFSLRKIAKIFLIISFYNSCNNYDTRKILVTQNGIFVCGNQNSSMCPKPPIFYGVIAELTAFSRKKLYHYLIIKDGLNFLFHHNILNPNVA